jgi:hypothetical protein
MKSNVLATLQWIHKETKLSKIILCSIHQLPSNKENLEELINNMHDVEFNFALEGIKGKGRNFLTKAGKEAKIFMEAKVIDSTKTTWLELNEMMTINKKSLKD